MKALFYILILLFFKSCSETDNSFLNTKYEVNNKLIFDNFNETIKYPNFNTDVIRVANNTATDTLINCTCFVNNGLIEVIISRNTGFVGETLIINANDSIFYSTYKHVGDIRSEEFDALPVQQNLIINTNHFIAGNILTGQVNFEGIGFSENTIKKNFSVKLEGKFKCKLKDYLKENP